MRITGLVLVGVAACGGAPAPSQPPPTHDAAVALISAEALLQRLSAATGRPRVVNFWATWCPPCVAELPELTRFADEQGPAGAELLLVNTNTANAYRGAVVPFVLERGLDRYEVVQLDTMDPPTALGLAVPGWPQALPFTLVLRPDGHRAELFDRPVTAADLRAAVRRAAQPK